MYALPVTAGSDSHHIHGLFGSGVELPRRVERPRDYLEMMRAGELKCLGGGRVLE